MGMPLEDGRMFTVVLGSAQERNIVMFDTQDQALNMKMCFFILLLSEKCWCGSGVNYLISRGFMTAHVPFVIKQLYTCNCLFK